jgi:hypothetical protein
MRLALSLVSLLCLCHCVSHDTVPTAADLDQMHVMCRKEMDDLYVDLDRQLAANEINADTYATKKAALDQRVQQRVMDRTWTRHDMAEKERVALGIPTPDHPVVIAAPRPGASGGGMNTSSFVPFNQRQSGTIGTTDSAVQQMGSILSNQANMVR